MIDRTPIVYERLLETKPQRALVSSIPYEIEGQEVPHKRKHLSMITIAQEEPLAVFILKGGDPGYKRTHYIEFLEKRVPHIDAIFLLIYPDGTIHLINQFGEVALRGDSITWAELFDAHNKIGDRKVVTVEGKKGKVKNIQEFLTVLESGRLKELKNAIEGISEGIGKDPNVNSEQWFRICDSAINAISGSYVGDELASQLIEVIAKSVTFMNKKQQAEIMTQIIGAVLHQSISKEHAENISSVAEAIGNSLSKDELGAVMGEFRAQIKAAKRVPPSIAKIWARATRG